MPSPPKVILLACPHMTDLAQRVAAASPAIELGEVDWRRFEDGFPNLLIKNVETLRGRHVAFLAAFDSPATVLEQLSVIHELPRYGAGALTVLLPYYPTATMERVNREGEIATAKTLARLLSVTPLSMGGPARIVVYDIHALQERFYFSDLVTPYLESAIPLIQERLRALDPTQEVAVAFPDEGAQKRFGAQLGGWPQILCHKIRQGTQRVITIKEGEPADQHVVIIDDLVKTGGTLLQCQRVLQEQGARAVSAFVSHGVFPQESWRRFLNAGFAHFWITDSCPQVAAQIDGQGPFEVLSLAGAIADFLSSSPVVSWG